MPFRLAMLDRSRIFKFGAIVPVTTEGRLIYLLRRGGRQVFGGGRDEISGACAALLARNEAYFEGNLVLNDSK